ncbi:MAG: maleate cis-trans isomerase [Alphaproteobacteria bacterium]|nr:maleate cis-trans isomerase [Alphaproteobacteria bacterium]
MSAERRKVGVLLPSSNTTVEYDFQRLVPGHISLHAARMWLTGSDAAAAQAMNAELDTASHYLGSARLDLIVYACTGGSLDAGGIAERIRAHAGPVPVVATAPAAKLALDALGMKRIAVATPYQDSMTAAIGAHLGQAGYRVLALAGRRLPDNVAIGNDPVDAIAAFAKATLPADADGLFLSCTNWRGLDVVERIERETGKPVVTSNQATIWATLRALGIDAPIAGYGRLLTLAPPNLAYAA